MSSDESDSSLSSLSDADITYSPCELEYMSSTSDDVDGCSGMHGQEPKYTFLKVKETSEVKQLYGSFNLDAIKELETYFNGLKRTDGKIRFFPKSMEQFVANQHPKILEQLKSLDFKDVFVYLGSTFAVTLNIHNERIKIPRRLICDALVFSSNEAVLVLSFVKHQTDMARRLDMYNNFVARGVTEALRTFLNDISVVRGVIEEGTNLSSCLPEMEKQTMFFHPSSISMDQDKRDAAVKAILKSVAVTQAAIVYTPSAYGASGKGSCFLNLSEFEFLSEFIDMKSTTSMHTAKGQKDILALEIASRISRRGKTAIHVQHTGHNEALEAHRNKHPNLDVFKTGTDIDCEKYEHIFAAKMSHIKGNKKSGGHICIISSSKSDSKPVKKPKKSHSNKSFLQRLFGKRATVKISQGPVELDRQSQSMPNLSTITTEELPSGELYQDDGGITLVSHKRLNEPGVKRSSGLTTVTTATQLSLQPPSFLPSAEDTEVRKCAPDVPIKRQSSTASESEYDKDSFTNDVSCGGGSIGRVSPVSLTSSSSSGYLSNCESPRRSETRPETQDVNMDS
ncbi:uncharacterized protein LOC124283628 isoform X2 [Haliotis rubra]|uniref:uncharacterized protein LOC124283628 isoform X2 n=1 Tax=Haliotis rubra TaxID=36100 RepID=UPI001EE52040|nr:uncharacterized protein LOC124283628 isoform X2 [Haliotis rubra]